MEQQVFLTTREAAEFLCVCTRSLYRWEKSGVLIPYKTPGGHRRYSKAMLEHYLWGTRTIGFEKQHTVVNV